MKKLFFALAAATCVSASAFAQVQVSDAWVRATVPQQQASGAFMTLRSPGAVRLVEVHSPSAARVELHQMAMQGDRMAMRQVDQIALPANTVLALASGGYHVMLMDLQRQLKAGETVELSLVFEGKDKHRETVLVKAPVKPLTYAPAASAHQ